MAGQADVHRTAATASGWRPNSCDIVAQWRTPWLICRRERSGAGVTERLEFESNDKTAHRMSFMPSSD
jgi:hypothetical protein